MLVNLLVGGVLMVLTTITHAAGMGLSLRVLKLRREDASHRGSLVRKTILVSALVLCMFLACVVETILWAVTYLIFGVITDPERAIYFSTVTYTTLGYGDVVIDGHWRLLSAFQAANGIILFGWTTALIVAVLQRIVPGAREPVPAINRISVNGDRK